MIVCGFLGGIVRSLVRLLVLLVLLGLAWLYREPLLALGGRIADRWEVLRRDAPAAGEPASAELAAAAEAKLDGLRAGTSGTAAFGSAELQSLLEYRYRSLLPAFVDSPRITLEGDRVRLRVRVPTARIPQVRELADIAGLLPDTTDLDVRGRLLPAVDGRAAFAVDQVSAGRIPLPGRLVPLALEMLGRTPASDLSPGAISIPLPPGVADARVRNDSLLLVTARAD